MTNEDDDVTDWSAEDFYRALTDPDAPTIRELLRAEQDRICEYRRKKEWRVDWGPFSFGRLEQFDRDTLAHVAFWRTPDQSTRMFCVDVLGIEWRWRPSQRRSHRLFWKQVLTPANLLGSIWLVVEFLCLVYADLVSWLWLLLASWIAFLCGATMNMRQEDL